VIGTESGEIGNVLRATGGGVVVPEADTRALCEALRTMEADPASRAFLAAAGRAAVRELYDQTHLAQRFASVIQEAVERKETRTDADRARYA
jgi:glycosyltransferase involved in cell wall biosynthesis